MPGVRGRPQDPEWVRKRIEARRRTIAAKPDFYKTFSTSHEVTPSMRQAISQKRIAHYQAHPEAREAIRQARLGTTMTASTKEKIKLKLQGRIFSEEHRKKISEGVKRQYEMNPNYRFPGRVIPLDERVATSKRMKAYAASEIARERRAAMRKGAYVKCRACEVQVYRHPGEKTKPCFCSLGCRNSWFRGRPNPNRSGKNHHNWKGGITKKNTELRNSLEYRAWRKSVFERDHFTCLVCGQVGGELNADHIKKFSKFPLLRFDISNGATLCVACHYLKTKRDRVVGG